MINIEKIKENIKCPQFGDLEYGKWGSLRLEQRIAYRDLINIVEEQDKVIKTITKQVSENEDTAIKLLKENVLLKSILKEIREYIDNNISGRNDGHFHYNFDGNITDILEILDKENK